MAKMSKRIVHLLGKGETWETINSINSNEEIYGCNDAFLRTPEVSKTFHMHKMKDFLRNPITASSTRLCIEEANKKPEMKFITVEDFPEIKNCVVYPIDEISEKFKTSYFTSTIDFMIAYSMWEGGVDKICLHGINLSTQQEYKDQKPGVEFWLGMARGIGIETEVVSPTHSSIYKNRSGLVYGYNIKPWRVD